MSKRIDAEYFRNYRAGKKPSHLDGVAKSVARKRSICGTCDQPWEYPGTRFRATCDACKEKALTKERSNPAYVNRHIQPDERRAIRQAAKSAFDPVTFRASMERARALGLIRERGKA